MIFFYYKYRPKSIKGIPYNTSNNNELLSSPTNEKPIYIIGKKKYFPKKIYQYSHLYTNMQLSREEGIRTLDTLLAYTRFPGVRLRPLGHLSKIKISIVEITKKKLDLKI